MFSEYLASLPLCRWTAIANHRTERTVACAAVPNDAPLSCRLLRFRHCVMSSMHINPGGRRRRRRISRQELAEVRLATREGWRYLRVQAIIVAIDQYADRVAYQQAARDNAALNSMRAALLHFAMTWASTRRRRGGSSEAQTDPTTTVDSAIGTPSRA